MTMCFKHVHYKLYSGEYLPRTLTTGFVFGVELFGEQDWPGEFAFPGLVGGDLSCCLAPFEHPSPFGVGFGRVHRRVQRVGVVLHHVNLLGWERELDA